MQSGGEPSAIERALPEMHLAALAQQYRLHRFITKGPKERREKYFGLIKEVLKALADAMGYPPPDGDLRDIVVKALTRDRTFLAFVINEGGGAQVTSEGGGKDLLCAGAGAILCEYLTVNGDAP